MQSQTPSIFAYTDFRAFLKDFYTHARVKNPRFSHRYISSRLGFASSGWFGDVLKGRANLGSATVVKLAALLELKDKEVDYLETLVLYNQSSTLEERNRHLRKLLSFKDQRVNLIGREQLEFFSNWYYTVIRELLFFHNFTGNVEMLAKKLMPPIKPAQAKRCLISLASCTKTLKAGTDSAVSEIEASRKRLMLLMEEDGDPERAYQFNIQFFPVTR